MREVLPAARLIVDAPRLWCLGLGAEDGLARLARTTFARLRPDSVLGEAVHVGNFVELKKARLAKGAKVGHLAYLGDGTVGEKANVGAGVIFCNYDGFNKARTEVGAGAFVGSNSSLVAPVSIGAGAVVGSGSVVTEDAPADALVFGRARQVNKSGAGLAFRDKAKSKKDAK